jgi:hypothetical protein
MIKPKLFEFKDSWIWFLVVFGFTAIFGYAYYYNNFVVSNQLPWQVYLISAMALVSVYAVSILRYIIRVSYLQEIDKFNLGITGTSPEGVEVSFTCSAELKVMGNLLGREKLKDKIFKTITESVDFWSAWGSSVHQVPSRSENACKSIITTYLKNSRLLVDTKPFKVALLPQKFSGLSFGNYVCVAWDGEIVVTEDQLMSLIRHEIGHSCLTALDVDPGYLGSSHHAIYDTYHYGA